jgi:hypothetical protein
VVVVVVAVVAVVVALAVGGSGCGGIGGCHIHYGGILGSLLGAAGRVISSPFFGNRNGGV